MGGGGGGIKKYRKQAVFCIFYVLIWVNGGRASDRVGEGKFPSRTATVTHAKALVPHSFIPNRVSDKGYERIITSNKLLD